MARPSGREKGVQCVPLDVKNRGNPQIKEGKNRDKCGNKLLEILRGLTELKLLLKYTNNSSHTQERF